MACTREAFRHPSLVNKEGVRDVVSACGDPVLQRNHPALRPAIVSATDASGVVVVWVYCSCCNPGWESRSCLTLWTLARVVAGPRRVCVWLRRHCLVPRCWKVDSCLRVTEERCEYGGVSCNRAVAGLLGDRIINTLHSNAGVARAMTQLVKDKRVGGTRRVMPSWMSSLGKEVNPQTLA